VGTMVAPWVENSSSWMLEPSPAARALAGPLLDEHLVAPIGQLTHPYRRDRHPVLVGFDLSGHADDQGSFLL